MVLTQIYFKAKSGNRGIINYDIEVMTQETYKISVKTLKESSHESLKQKINPLLGKKSHKIDFAFKPTLFHFLSHLSSVIPWNKKKFRINDKNNFFERRLEHLKS